MKINKPIVFILVNKQTSIVRTCGSKIGAKLCYKTAGTNSVRKKKFFFCFLRITIIILNKLG